MGFTPLEGLVMATRSGSVDPSLLLWLMERTGIAERELAHALDTDRVCSDWRVRLTCATCSRRRRCP